MSTITKLLKPKQVCDSFGVLPYDTPYCLWCSQQWRTARGCVGTCLNMGFQICPVLASVDNCGCSDGTTQKGAVVVGAWIGFIVPTELAAVAAKICPEGLQAIRYQLYRSLTDPDTGLTTTNLECPPDTNGWGYIPIADGGDAVDLPGGSIERNDSGKCVGGALFLSAEQLGITMEPNNPGAPDGSVSCNQKGGAAALLWRMSADCTDQQILLCPMDGAGGGPYDCASPPNFCDKWEITEVLRDGCNIEITFHHIVGECPVTVTVDGVTLEGNSATIHRTISPCSEGNSVTVTVVSTWPDGCAENCAQYNSTVETVYSF